MKSKSIKIILALQFFCFASFSQLKIVNTGNVGIGTSTPMGKLHVNGRIILTGNNNLFRILPDNPGTEIGSSTDHIDFWYTFNGFNTLTAQSYYTISDSSLKQDISPLDNSISILKQLNAKKYHYKPILDSTTNELHYDTTHFDYGFLAQDVEQILPGLIYESKGYKAIAYEEIIPFLVEAIKEQQQSLDSVISRLTTIEQTLALCCSTSQRTTFKSQINLLLN